MAAPAQSKAKETKKSQHSTISITDRPKSTKPLVSAVTRRYRSILSRATQVWGSEVDAAAWLNNGHPELQNATPKSLLNTAAGERTVENLLASLEYGFSV